MSAISNVVRQVRDRQGTPLLLCRIRLDFPSNDARKPTNVLFDLSLGTETLGSISIPATQIGVPLRYSEARLLRSADYRLPAPLLDYMREHLPPDQPLYLAFESPHGYLPGVPWEKLATSALRRPVLRLGVTSVRPVLPQQTMDVVYCCSLPPNAGISPAVVVTDFIRQLPRQLPQLAQLHVFTHRSLTSLLQRKIDSLGLGGRVIVYTPPEMDVCPIEGGSNTLSDVPEVSQIQNPWLIWMRDSLRQVSIDGVHFVCTGYLGRTKAGLRLSEAPMQTDQMRCAEIISTRELSMFLQQIGAWSVAFSSPPFNGCDLGLRMLFHQISSSIAGPTAFHDIASDMDANALSMLYRYVFVPQDAPLPASPALALSTHPSWAGVINQQWDERMGRLVREYTVLGQTESGIEQNPAPAAWVTAQQRILEKSISGLANEPTSPAEKAREDGILAALKFTSDLLAKYTGRGGNDKGSSGGSTS